MFRARRSRIAPGALAARRQVAVVCLLVLSLAGCANFSPDGGMSSVVDQTGALIDKDAVKIRDEREAAAAQARVKALLSKTLSSGTAVQIALLNNRGLQVAYNELGITEARLIEATLPPAPTLSLLRIASSGELEIERQVLQNILGLLTLPRRREIAEGRFVQAQARAAEATLRVAADAKRAYYRAVAAQQSVTYLEQARVSAEAISELSKKLGETGAMPKIDQTREHALYAEVSGELAVARLKERSEREKLNRALGLWGDQTTYRLPKSLDALPARPKRFDDVESVAVTTRVDLEVARMEIASLAKEYGLTHATRWIDVLDVRDISKFTRTERTVTDFTLLPGPALAKTTTPAREASTHHGVELEFKIPIYDFGEARTKLAEETYLQAVNRLLEKAVNVRSEAREAYAAYRGSYDIARHYEKEILPLREIISQQQLLAYNGMIADLFALLTDARMRISANAQAISAKRDFWLASAELEAAIAGGGQAADAGVVAAGAARLLIEQ